MLHVTFSDVDLVIIHLAPPKTSYRPNTLKKKNPITAPAEESKSTSTTRDSTMHTLLNSTKIEESFYTTTLPPLISSTSLFGKTTTGKKSEKRVKKLREENGYSPFFCFVEAGELGGDILFAREDKKLDCLASYQSEARKMRSFFDEVVIS